MTSDLPELLSAEQMQRVDARAAESGLDTFSLMQAAGRAVANHVLSFAPRAPVITVMAGAGNNGGDGYIAAAELQRLGCDVMVIATLRESRVSSDAARAAANYQGPVIRVVADIKRLPDDVVQRFDNSDVIIDALFGAGLCRPIVGANRLMIEQAAKVQASSKVHVVAVDLPSGLDGNNLVLQDVSIRADSTVTFFRYKLAHLSSPGRQNCGDITLSQIGLTQRHLDPDARYAKLNSPNVFLRHLPDLPLDVHKYTRGAVLVRGGPLNCTGAARLSAGAALRCGAGLVTLTSPTDALAVNASQLTAVMLAVSNGNDDWQRVLNDGRWRVALVGPGNGVDQSTQDAVLSALQSELTCILDADALSCWQGQTDRLFAALLNASRTPVLTPHAGEFERLFDSDITPEVKSQIARTQAAAAMTRSVIVYKGANTIIAGPDGQISINNNAPPWLATAGSGDVLAGIVAALVAQGMPTYEATLASVWVHGEAATRLGCPMTAEQLGTATGEVLSDLLS